MAIMVVMRFVFASLIAGSRGDGFLRATPRASNERLSEEEIRKTLLEEIEASLGAGSATNRLALLEATLLPVYNALPKNQHGNLGHSTVRYALHRLFVMRHGWNIKGLREDVSSFNSSSSVGILLGNAPSYVQRTFEERLGDQGLNLRELAVLASTIEHLVHDEAAGKVTAVFEALQFSTEQTLNDEEVTEILDTYMMALIIGQNVSTLSLGKIKKLVQVMPEIFTGWLGSQKFVRRIWQKVIHDEDNALVTKSGMDFATVAKIVEVVGEEYGSFQNIECQELKHTLMNIEHRGLGRVKLADFYKPALNGAWQFQESVSYLRQLGALDESDANNMAVIIPNYLHSQTNCVAASGFYSVCCKNECEALLGHLEEELSCSEPTPAQILKTVEMLPSPTVMAPRKVSKTLLGRLDDISEHHGGLVPLHGRLFAQWMHHAFPRECPYPHLSGTTSQLSADQWLSESGNSGDATVEEMRQFVTPESNTHASLDQDPTDGEDILLWSAEEELLVVRPELSPLAGQAGVTTGALRCVMMFLAAISLALGLVKSWSQTRNMNDVDHGKFIV